MVSKIFVVVLSLRLQLVWIFIGVLSLLVSCAEQPKTIGIQPFGDLNLTYCDSIKVALEKVYPNTVVILNKIEIPEHTFVNIKSPRYRADDLIEYLKGSQPKGIDFTIGLISKDISTTKKGVDGKVKEPKSRYEDWGVFGLGYRPGPSCIVSTFRLKNSNSKLFFSRLQKIAVHEIGHNMGLKHCPNEGCVMQDAAETIKTIDKVKLELCGECLGKI